MCLSCPASTRLTVSTGHILVVITYRARYVSSFAGFGPASNPRLVCIVVINDPTGEEYYGGLVAAPLFSEVMTGAMRISNIPPDDYPAMLVNAGDTAGGQ